MNRKNLLYIIAGILTVFVSCQKLDYQQPDDAKEISAFKCFVYYDEENYSLYKELDVLSGTYNPGMGAVNFTFPDEPEWYNDNSLQRCRLEVTIPSTAVLVETDAFGNELGTGIGGMRDLRSRTVYFKVKAADGGEKKYQASFNYKK